MNQDIINDAEWRNPDNWSAVPDIFTMYFSNKDSRTWVPKRIPSMGVTINLAKPGGVAFLYGVIVGIPLFIVLITALGWFFTT